ncbi:MAG: lysylphosphatidylglycerol synthase transmembrane domain-containing protein [Candidatus Woesearchaeota archaeon]
MKVKNLSIWLIVVGIAVFAFILGRFPIENIIKQFLNASIKLVIVYFAISFLIIATHTLRWSVILRSQGCYVPFAKLFSYKMIGYGVSFLTPTAKLGGEPVRAAILQRDGIDIAEAASSTFIDKFMEMSLCGILFILGLMFFMFSFKMTVLARILIFSSCIIVTLLTIYFYAQMFRGRSCIHRLFKITRVYKIKFFKKHQKKIIKVENLMIKFFKKEKKFFALAVLITMLSWVFMFVEYKSAAAIVGRYISIPQVFIIFSVVGAAYMIPIPLALGTLEASQISLFSVLRLGTTAGLAISLLIKFRELVFTAIGLVFLAFYGLDFRKTYQEAIDDFEEK